MERYEAYKDSGVEWIGEIPAGWDTAPLKSVFGFGKGLPITKADLVEEGIPVISYGQIHSKTNTAAHVDDSLLRYVPESFLTTGAASLTQQGDFLFADTSEDVEGCGNFVFHDRVQEIFAGYHTLILSPTVRDYGRYLSYLFQSDEWRSQIRSRVSGVKLFSLTQRVFVGVSILLPQLHEQLAIADYLDEMTAEIDALVEDCEREVELLQEYRKAVISEAVTKGLDASAPMKDSGIEWIGEIPAAWGCENLGGHSRMLTPMRDKPEDLTGMIPWVRIEDYDGKYITASKEGLGVSNSTVEAMNLKIYPVGTLLCTSSCDLGKCAIVAKELVSNQRFIGIIPTDYQIDYLYYLMLSNAERLSYLSTGTIQANLSRKAFEHLRLPYPPLDEQCDIAAYLDTKTAEIDSLIEARQQMAERLREYRKSLISEAVTGKFKVPGLNHSQKGV